MMVTGVKAVVRAEILPRDFLQTLGSCYFSFTTAKIQILKINNFLKIPLILKGFGSEIVSMLKNKRTSHPDILTKIYK